jgi:signal transduction histidine kinase/predicted CoA-binding protein
MYDFLEKVPLFSGLPEEDLERLCAIVDEVRLHGGEFLFHEGERGEHAYVIQEGQIEILKTSGGREVLLAVRQKGEVIGEMALLDAAPRFASVRARTDSSLLSISHAQLEHLLDTSPSAARAMLYTVTARLRSSELVLRQSEKMAQLGTLTAGIAHELNNPAAAVRRGSEQLRQAIQRLKNIYEQIRQLELSAEQQGTFSALEQETRKRAAEPLDIESLWRSDREAELEEWLNQQGIDEAWELAPVLAYLDLDLDKLAKDFTPQMLGGVLNQLAATYTVYSLLEEISQGAGRIGEIVKALKTYVYLDQAPVQAVDIHEGLDNTLVMLRSKLKGGASVRREYAPDLPRIQAYGSELNQVWTNLIVNAVDAMDGIKPENGRGEIALRTRLDGDWIVVEVEDNGPGIPAEIIDKIFSPFFTTKPVGKGTGLGLNISYNIVQKHGGEIKVFSRPGKTCFQVRLPVSLKAVQEGGKPLIAIPQLSDEELKDILVNARAIAVVGLSAQADAPAHSVPAYLQRRGYRIIPINPNLEKVLGEKAYPDLLAVPEPVDIVQIFRRSEAVLPIVEQAIRIGARVVWMQEGIVNEAAAEVAREAGLKVVMNTCMRTTHRRLFPQLAE